MKGRRINIIRALIFITALVFIFIGIGQNDHGTVLRKAVRICLECIGVGA